MRRILFLRKNGRVKRNGVYVFKEVVVLCQLGNDLKIKDFELRAKPPQGPQAQALTVSDSPVYHAFARHRIYNPDTNTT